MAETLRNHTCGYYCTDDRHAVEVIAQPHMTADAVRCGYSLYAQRFGWQVCDVQRAKEADVEDWRMRMQKDGWGLDERTHTKLTPNTVPDGPIVGWLVWIEPVECSKD